MITTNLSLREVGLAMCDTRVLARVYHLANCWGMCDQRLWSAFERADAHLLIVREVLSLIRQERRNP
jgi:hypothetical protein